MSFRNLLSNLGPQSGAERDIFGQTLQTIGANIGGPWSAGPIMVGGLNRMRGARETAAEEEAEQEAIRQHMAGLQTPTTLDFGGFAGVLQHLTQSPGGWNNDIWGAHNNLMTAMGNQQQRRLTAAGKNKLDLSALTNAVKRRYKLSDGSEYALPAGVDYEMIGKEAGRQYQEYANDFISRLMDRRNEVAPLTEDDFLRTVIQFYGGQPYTPPEGAVNSTTATTPTTTTPPRQGIPNPNPVGSNRQTTPTGDIIGPDGTVIPAQVWNAMHEAWNLVFTDQQQAVANAIASGTPPATAIANSLSVMHETLILMKQQVDPHGMTPGYFADFERMLTNPELFNGDVDVQNQFRNGANGTVRVGDQVEFSGTDGQPMRGQIVGFQGNQAMIIIDLPSLPDGGQSLLDQGINPQQPVMVAPYQLNLLGGQQLPNVPMSP